jgi:hypothetical protein
MKHFVEFFLQHVHPCLLINKEPPTAPAATDSMPVLLMWINNHGHPMEYSSYMQGLQAVSQQFHPLLRLLSLSFHRAFITAFYKGKISYKGSLNDFRCNVGQLLNVAETVMETHYNHHSAGPTNIATQEALTASVNLADDQVQACLAVASSQMEAATDPNKHQVATSEPQQLLHLTSDDGEWHKIMAKAGIMPAAPHQALCCQQALAAFDNGTFFLLPSMRFQKSQ